LPVVDQAGLYTVIFPTLVFALLCSSREHRGGALPRSPSG
jgi:hypothetical protein